MLLFDVAGILTGLSGAAIALISLITTVIVSRPISEALVKRLSASIKGADVIMFDELGNHDLIIKLQLYKTSTLFKALDGITDPRKLMLFRNYINLLCDAILAEVVVFTERTVLDYSDQKLKNEILIALSRAENKFENQFRQYLTTLNNDKLAVNTVSLKLSTWRYEYMSIMMENCESVISGSGPKVSAYTIATIFSVVMTGIDYLKKNGLESFNRLNGELDSFTNKIELQ